MTCHRPRSRAAGFSFVEILVVMGIIATLAGLGVVVVNLWIKRGPQQKTQALVAKMKGYVDAWKTRFHDYPPMSVKDIDRVIGIKGSVEIKSLDNEVNLGIESVYQAIYWNGFGTDAELSEAEVGNKDDDRLRQAVTTRGPELNEAVDGWGNPLIYFVNTGYAKADQNPPTYTSEKHGEVHPKPWREPGGGFVNPNGFQVFSMGPDQEPNTDDDVCTWR